MTDQEIKDQSFGYHREVMGALELGNLNKIATDSLKDSPAAAVARKLVEEGRITIADTPLWWRDDIWALDKKKIDLPRGVSLDTSVNPPILVSRSGQGNVSVAEIESPSEEDIAAAIAKVTGNIRKRDAASRRARQAQRDLDNS